MIALSSDFLVFTLASGEAMPISPEMLSFEMMGDTAKKFEPEFLQNAANAVFHYFKKDLGRQTVTIGEFAGALEKVLHGFKPQKELDPPQDKESGPAASSKLAVAESDLSRLASESGGGCELMFFPRLRDELRQQLGRGPRVVRFRGLRGCVKQLAGARRWSPRCSALQDQIVTYLRECLCAESRSGEMSLVVE